MIASYVFYGWWDWRFLSLIIVSSFGDFLIGKLIHKEEKKTTRKLLLITSLLINLGFLGFFKYYNFFLESFIDAFTFLGWSFSANRLNIILPVGISFYTFQTLSYTIDIYRKKLEPTKDIVAFFAFVSFFPQLVAGPIERATNLLPQFFSKRAFSYSTAADGMRQILWGLFKKIVIADNCAILVNQVFGNHLEYGGGMLLLGSFLFAMQIYCDFSGYSDIAIGTARLFGFNLMRNFAFPYFSRDIAEFWRRWHISLSTWFRDYLYIPLGGSNGSSAKRIRNVFIIFVVSGFWHGANWTFIIWGALNAVYFLPLLLTSRNRVNLEIVAANKMLPSLKEVLQIAVTFLLTLVAWVFFRAENVSQALSFLNLMLIKESIVSVSEIWVFISSLINQDFSPLLFFFLAMEWIQRTKSHALEGFFLNTPALRWSTYLFVFMAILLKGVWTEQDFIYFQF